MKQRRVEKRINIPPHQGVLDRAVATSMNGNELFLCLISGSVTIKQHFEVNTTTYYNSNTGNSRKEERRPSPEFFLEWIAQPCSSIVEVSRMNSSLDCSSVGLGLGVNIHKTAGKPRGCIDEPNQKPVPTSIKAKIILPPQKRTAIYC